MDRVNSATHIVITIIVHTHREIIQITVKK
jgi:hypothetical protein